MSTVLIQPSFAAGELSPSLYARVDLAKYHVAAALMRNMFVDYKGGAASRGGSAFVGKSKQIFGVPPRLIPFQFNQTQTYALEFGQNYIRFVTAGGYILEAGIAITGITNANPGVVTAPAHGFSNGDWVQLDGIVGMTQLNGKTFIVTAETTNTFELTDLWGTLVDTTSYTTFTSGGTASRYYTLVSPYAASDLPLLKWTQSADVLTLTHPSYPIYNLNRLGQTDWTITAVSYAAKQVAPVAISAVPSTTTPTPLAAFSYVVTAVNAITGEESAASNIVTCQSVDISQTAGSITITWDAAAGAGTYNVYKAPVGYNTTETPIGALYGLIGSTTGLQMVDGNIEEDLTTTPPLHLDPFAPGQIQYVTVTAGGTTYSQSPTFTFTTVNGTGAVLQGVVISGVLQAVIIIDAGENFAPGDTATVHDSTGSGATITLTIGAVAGTYPGCTTYYQQRQWFANSLTDPDTFWATQPGNFNNMDASIPIQAGDAIIDTISSQQVNGIQAMVAMPTGLVILTGLGAWQLTGSGGPGTTITPEQAQANAQAYNGCSTNVPPIVVNYDIVYVQEKGSIYRDLQYNFFVNVYTGTDITVLSNHLFTGYTILEHAYAEEPYKIIWAVRNDGVLLSLTFLKEQDVNGWSHHDTFGLYVSICSISEPPVNAVYTVVQRFLNGQWVYYVERFNDRLWNVVEDVWAVDAGLQTTPTYPNAILTVSAAGQVGDTVTLTASAASFNNGMVGSIVRTGGGILELTGYSSTTVMIAEIIQNISSVLQNDPASSTDNGIPTPVLPNDWSIWPQLPTNTDGFPYVTGLDHLDGATVSILADGSVQDSRPVVNGTVVLDKAPVTLVTIGLGYQAQLGSMYIDAGNPTIQGKRKNIPALTARVFNSRGLKFGPNLDTVVEHKDRGNAVYAGTPIPLFTGDVRQVLPQQWQVPGQVYLQQDYPLPMTVLGIMPEINVGDTNG